MEIAMAALPLEQDDAGRETGQTQVNLRLSFEACCGGLYRFILVRVGGERHAADELLQQVCCVAIDHRRPPNDPAACEPWFRGIAVNLIRKHWRIVKRSNGHLRIDVNHQGGQLAEDMESRPLPPDVLARQEASGLRAARVSEQQMAGRQAIEHAESPVPAAGLFLCHHQPAERPAHADPGPSGCRGATGGRDRAHVWCGW